jgi:hypothetical protein
MASITIADLRRNGTLLWVVSDPLPARCKAAGDGSERRG